MVALALYAAVVTKDAEKDMEADAIDIQPRVEANEQIKVNYLPTLYPVYFCIFLPYLLFTVKTISSPHFIFANRR